MSIQKKISSKSINLIKNCISLLIGAGISCGTTIGIMNKNDSKIIKDKIDIQLEKVEDLTISATQFNIIIAEINLLISQQRYIEALVLLNKLNISSKEILIEINNLKKEIKQNK